MKNLYIYLLMTCSFLSSYAQVHDAQNANWCFGDQAALTFLPNFLSPVNLSSNPDTSYEGFASVSDQSGNLLFYTDGTTVRNSNHNVMPNGFGLLGGQSNTQGPIIVPKPSSKSYYIITIDGYTEGQSGLYYSEVDMSLESGLGDIVSSTKNTVLYDHNNIPIDASYVNNSEKLTSTKHCNSEDYWIVTQTGDFVYSYLVTNSGISQSPTSYTLAPISISTLQLPATNSQAGVGQMKISPDGKNLGVCYNRDGVVIADFNNATGEITFNNNIISVSNTISRYYGLEFSNSGEYCYFSNNGGIYRVPAYNNPSSTDIETIQGTTGGVANLQLAINGKIYCTNNLGILPNNQLNVINDPNNAIDPDFESDVLLLSGEPYSSLPQWVHEHATNCIYSIILTSPEITYSYFIYAYQHSITTTSDYTVDYGQNIAMKAGSYILLEPNTYIAEGAIYSALIEECGSCAGSQRPGNNINNLKTTLKPIKRENNEISSFSLFPNPSNNIVNLSHEKGITTIMVISIDGKAVYNTTANGNKEHIIDVKNFSKGIYLITIETTEGEVYTKKLIIE